MIRPTPNKSLEHRTKLTLFTKAFTSISRPWHETLKCKPSKIILGNVRPLRSRSVLYLRQNDISQAYLALAKSAPNRKPPRHAKDVNKQSDWSMLTVRI